jgi:hypothetical protein
MLAADATSFAIGSFPIGDWGRLVSGVILVFKNYIRTGGDEGVALAGTARVRFFWSENKLTIST